ncbi:PHA/PHB synthase family protein, partial [Brevundimonas sp.]|uniref:PHA/PHB synthase family protein n=1 Tax=Brevundimonas sp. TaxID=1871086 RepID=UPI003D6CC071
VLDSVSPANFPRTNPEVLGRVVETGGLCLAQGMATATDDWFRLVSGAPAAGADTFRVGETVAVTEGEVILRTPLCEVIQYRPKTATVQREPVVIVPAWILKYYILDLSPRNSLVRHLIEQGFTVFMISWKNPTPADRDIGFDDYRRLGVLPALTAALAITGATKAHAVGYCLGGTLLAIAAAAMARDGDDRIASLTFLAAQTDFDEAGELKLFINDSQVAFIEDLMWQRGVLAGSQMAGTFHLLRSNDLVWSKMIHRYLMGEPDPVSDISAWLANVTHMPYRMHSDYLRSLYLNNDLAAGRFKVDGRPIVIQDIRTPIFALGAESDRVAPWRSVYKFRLLADADVTFALTNGGHNLGVVSEPGHEGRNYRIGHSGTRDHYVDPDSWFGATPVRNGSWWPAWFDWLRSRPSERVAPPPQGRREAGYHSLGPAPGSYVFE